MTYYEELGVPPEASAEQIHEAYRNLARLLHPDRCQEKKLRALAERQMVRLNRLHQILSDPENRRVYDASLRLLEPPPALLMAPKWRWWSREHQAAIVQNPASVWVAGGLLVLAAMIVSLMPRSEPPRPIAMPLPSAVEHTQALPLAGEVNREEELARQVEQLRAERDRAMIRAHALDRERRTRALEQPPADPAPSFEKSPSFEMPMPIASAEPAAANVMAMRPAPAPPVIALPAPSTNNHDMAGSWYYMDPNRARSRNDLYPPEFIETVIVDENGVLRGHYRARYRVPDRAISPHVVFQFSGKAGEQMARLPWLGEGGSRGEVRLKLVSENRLEVQWVASDLGRSLGLGSGTAILVRRQER